MANIKSKPTLSWAIEHAKAFRRAPRDGFVAVFADGEQGITYRNAEFDKLDTRYLEVYRALKKNKKYLPYGLNPSVLRHVFRMSQILWSGSELSVFEDSEAQPRVILKVHSVLESTVDNQKLATLAVESFQINKLSNGVLFGNSWLKKHKLTLSHEQLEQLFPGSVLKVLNASALELSPDEIAQAAFSESVGVDSAPLPEDFTF